MKEVEERRRERPSITQRMASPRAQRGLPSAELLSAVAVVLAGYDQGRLPRARQYRRQLRTLGAQPQPRDEAAKRGLAQDLREACDAACVHALQRVPARPVLLPILRPARRSHLRPSGSALARRSHHLDQRGGGLLAL